MLVRDLDESETGVALEKHMVRTLKALRDHLHIMLANDRGRARSRSRGAGRPAVSPLLVAERMLEQ